MNKLRKAARRLRRDATPAEQRLWQALRANALGVPFRRQHPIPPHIADFAAPGPQLVIEVDGGQHGGAADEDRDAAMRAAGWRVLRLWNNEVLANLEGVLHRITEALGRAEQGR
ncbi:MAG TPA: endonuclease domain-containing protein [Falsiroseomonas sp.]|jgi:very-short-patch-repair endonuclease|nr:endonuclease domain-containing protein [Falsiroseomonas sp.]